ncbi:hypothetical protein OESDEN_12802 [Oesophagostomum dentatum]|uniref:Carbohydrate kinase PfkB domain-containing protein n=1 Tax=Oesophagostomum dentatum TaxID=61180 RepID=A0A0B1SU50_OESDE|nr:hypothetical protein OESDEN_12802 [Oesophagostomum dentatum]
MLPNSADCTLEDKPRIIVFGSIIQDLISYTDRFPKPGESVPGSDFVSSRGGKGANQAIAAARLGGAVSIIGRVSFAS